jgi:energy-converting hydrogenase Eha subunit A
MGDGMKEILITFGAIVSVLVGLILIYANLFSGNPWEIEYQVGAGFGVLFLAAGITGLLMKGRFKHN